MIVENPELLKAWLVVILDPICEADASALARYVLALLKKDKPEPELKNVMIEQLDVFLGTETIPFVEKLFISVNSQEYLNMPDLLLTARSLGFVAEDAPDDPDRIATIDTENGAAAVQSVDRSSAGGEDDADADLDANVEVASSTDLDGLDDDLEDYEDIPITDESFEKDLESPEKTVDSDGAKASSSSFADHTFSPTYEILSPEEKEHTIDHTTKAASRAEVNQSQRSSFATRARSGDRDERNKFASESNTKSRESSEHEALFVRDRYVDSHSHNNNKRRDRGSSDNRNRSRSPSEAITDLRYMLQGGGGDRRRNNFGFDRRKTGATTSGGRSSSVDRSPRLGGTFEHNERGRMRQNRSSTRSRSPSPDRGRGNLSVGSHKRSPVDSLSIINSSDAYDTLPSSGDLPSTKSDASRKRCRDFDEKGYCVRGETCPWDHGVDPVVFENINNGSMLNIAMREYNPDAPDLWSRVGSSNSSNSGMPSFNNNVRPSGMLMGQGIGGPLPYPGPSIDKNMNSMEYGTGGYNTAPHMLQYPFNSAAVTAPMQRELIPIPVVEPSISCGVASISGGDVCNIGGGMPSHGKRRFDVEDTVAVGDGPVKRKPLNARLGPRPGGFQSNFSLELRKVPRGLNTIAHLNNHFSKFGKIVNIQVSYDGDPEAAIVTFSAHAEANVAYRSTEAVLNNRFIKVFWHNPDLTSDSNNSNLPLHTGGRKNSQYHLTNVPAVPTSNIDTAKLTSNATNTTSPATQNVNAAGGTNESGTSSADANNSNTNNAASISTNRAKSVNTQRPLPPGGIAVNPNARKRHHDEQAKAMAQLANGLRKRKQELLTSYLKQMKSTLDLIERCEPTDPQRAKALETMKVLQTAIDKLRNEIAAENEQMQAQIQNLQPPPPKKTKEQQKKELLDMELELFAQQQDGKDTTALQKRIEEMQRVIGIVIGSPNSAASAGGAGAKSVNYASCNRSNTRPHSAFTEGSTRVDRRPKTIVVNGFTSEEADFVLGHFKHFGEIAKHDLDKESNRLILSYVTRGSAEQAIIRGKVFKDKRLQVNWAPVVQTAPAAIAGSDGAAVVAPLQDKTVELDNKLNVKPKIPTITDAIGKADELTASDADATKSTKNETTDAADFNSINTHILPELTLSNEDEEEEEDGEARSWRR